MAIAAIPFHRCINSISAIANSCSIVEGSGSPSGAVDHGLTVHQFVETVERARRRRRRRKWQQRLLHVTSKINSPTCNKLTSLSKSICRPRDRVWCSFSYPKFNLLQSFPDSLSRCHSHTQRNLTKPTRNFLASHFKCAHCPRGGMQCSSSPKICDWLFLFLAATRRSHGHMRCKLLPSGPLEFARAGACSGPLRMDSNFVGETSNSAELSCLCMFLYLDAAGPDDGPTASSCQTGGENLVINLPSSRADTYNFYFRPWFITRCVSSVQFFCSIRRVRIFTACSVTNLPCHVKFK